MLLPVELVVAVAIAAGVWRSGHALIYHLGGWAPPLGVALRADGFSAVMLVTSSVVLCATALFARPAFRTPPGTPERRVTLVFWTLLLAVSGALNAVFLGNDLFNLYVALELLTFAAVPLVCLDGRAETLAAALRYLLFALLGSVLYLLGAALLYGAYGTLDIGLLHARIHAETVTYVAAALMTAGLLAKTALFPLHLWLPPAHAGAPPAASAVLSALVVKGSFFLTVRLWFYVLPGVPNQASAQVLAALGAAAILVGSAVALRQARLKLLIAYSTVAQIGYLFLMFPLAAGGASGQFWSAGAWTGRYPPGRVACLRQGGDVHGRGADGRGAGPRPHRRAEGHRARAADDRHRLRARRAVADGGAAERRVRREMAVADRLRRRRPMVVGGGDPDRRAACWRLRVPGARLRDGDGGRGTDFARAWSRAAARPWCWRWRSARCCSA